MRHLSAKFKLMLMLAVVSIACGPNINCNPFTAEKVVSQSFPSGIKRVTVESYNGSIEVSEATGEAVEADVTKWAGGLTQQEADGDLKNIEVSMTVAGDVLSVIARRVNTRTGIGNSGARAAVRVPAGTTLDLRTTNGEVTLVGPLGDTVVRSTNGIIDARGTAGQLDLSTTNYPITVNGGAGQLLLENQNGGISVTSDNVVVTARTINGPINYTGALGAGNHSFHTENSSMTLTLPANASFNIDADATNGRILNDFQLVSGGTANDGRLHGSVGTNPTMSLDLYNLNGNITLRKSL